MSCAISPRLNSRLETAVPANDHDDMMPPVSSDATPIERIETKLEQIWREVYTIKKDLIGTDIHSAGKSLVGRVTELERRLGPGTRLQKIIDNAAGQLLTSIVLLAAAALFFFKSLPSDAAARINALQPVTAKEPK